MTETKDEDETADAGCASTSTGLKVNSTTDIPFQHREMSTLAYLYATCALGLLCGWYFIILILFPLLIYLSFSGSYIAMFILVLLITLTILPLDHRPNKAFMYSNFWQPLRDYFSFECDSSSVSFEEGKKYIFFEFPHGIFPMGQFLSASIIDVIFPGHMICGIGADAIFMFPVMRQVMAWIGTQRATKGNIKKILNAGHHCAILPGGIAEMYLSDKDCERVYFKKRFKTVQSCIEEGANIIPVFFFGNTKLFNTIGSSGEESFLSSVSRRLRLSIVFFYGRFGLPIPFRHPLTMVSGEIVQVTKNPSPSVEEVEEVMRRVESSLMTLYNSKKPVWEKRPLIIE